MLLNPNNQQPTFTISFLVPSNKIILPDLSTKLLGNQ